MSEESPEAFRARMGALLHGTPDETDEFWLTWVLGLAEARGKQPGERERRDLEMAFYAGVSCGAHLQRTGRGQDVVAATERHIERLKRERLQHENTTEDQPGRDPAQPAP